MNNSNLDPVTSSLQSLGLPLSIAPKINELSRLMNIKFPVGSLKKAESCRQIFAVEISCRLGGIAFDKAALISRSNIGEKDYQMWLNIIKTTLGVNWTTVSPVELLTVRFGDTLRSLAVALLSQYKTKYVNLLDKSMQNNICLESAVYYAAAFVLAAKLRKVTLSHYHYIASTIKKMFC